MTVDVKQIGVVADASDDVLVRIWPARFGRGLPCRILPFFLLLWQVDAPPPAVLYGLHSIFARTRLHSQNISEPWANIHRWACSHTCRSAVDESGVPKSIQPAEYGAGLELAITDYAGLHASGTFVKLTQSGADLFA